MHPQRTLIEAAMYCVEAKEGDLFRHLRRAISDEYSIPHNQIETAVSVDKMVDGVYADHSNSIHAKHLKIGNDKDKQAGDKLTSAEMDEAKSKFGEFVRDTHSRYTNR